VAKLTDFGIASMPSSSMTQTGTMLGSPKYMSPEQVLGQPVDGRADIFSLGVVLYEMLVRRTPFELPDITTFSLMQRIVTATVPRVSGLGMNIPVAFDAILMRALAKRPEDRFQRAIEFATALRNYNRSAGPAVTVIAPPVDEATVVARRNVPDSLAATQPPRNDAEEQEKMARLLEDLEAFSHNFEKEEARKRAEAEAARAKAAEAAARAGAEAARREQDASAASRAKSALIGILHKQATAKAQQRPGQPSRESVQAFDAKLRKAFSYLVEFVRLLNEAAPAFGGELNMIYAGSLPSGTLSNGLVNYRLKKVEDAEVIDHITLSYRMNSEQKARVTLNKDEARALKAHLERCRFKYEEREEKAVYGKVPRVTIAIECNIPATAMLRADYGAFAVRFECVNIGQIGMANYLVGADQFDDEIVEEFGKFVLGFPSRFTGFRRIVGVG
jgi:hypothetical protein